MAGTPCVIDDSPESGPKETGARKGKKREHESDESNDANEDEPAEFSLINTFEVKSQVQVMVVEKRTYTAPPNVEFTGVVPPDDMVVHQTISVGSCRTVNRMVALSECNQVLYLTGEQGAFVLTSCRHGAEWKPGGGFAPDVLDVIHDFADKLNGVLSPQKKRSRQDHNGSDCDDSSTNGSVATQNH
jgi:hypothetical protein